MNREIENYCENDFAAPSNMSSFIGLERAPILNKNINVLPTIVKETINVLFLDYDGVVNVPMWNEEGTKCSYGYPRDGKVNSFQACQWVSEFCQKYNFKIVVISSWRKHDNYQECLYNGGLRKAVDIIGKTESLYPQTRGDEIRDWLTKHPEVNKFIIFDDELIDGLEDKQIHCTNSYGFGEYEFHQAVTLVRDKDA